MCVVIAALAGVPDLTAAAKWLRVQTPDVLAYSDASEKDLVEVVVHYAAYRQALRELFLPPGRSLPPVTLMVFLRQKSLIDITGSRPNGDNQVGHFTVDLHGERLEAFALEGNRAEAIARTIEFDTVWGLRRMGYHFPVWLTQGTGEVLATLRIQKERCLLGLADDQHDRQFHGKLISWPHFFEISEKSAEYRRSMRSGEFHGQAWALMHWIIFADAGARDRFNELSERLRSSSGVAAVQAAMATPAEDFQRVIRSHLDNFKSRELVFDATGLRADLKPAPANEAEVFVRKAELFAAAGKPEKCNEAMARAEQLGADLACVKEAWARRAILIGESQLAAQLYRQAIAAGSTNPSAFLASAKARLDESSIGNTDTAGSGGRNAALALEEIRAALRLFRGNPDAYRLLGRAFFILPKVTDADIAELSAGVGSGEDGEAVRFYRALLYSRLGKKGEYRADLEQILADPDSDQDTAGAASRCLGNDFPTRDR